MHGRAAFTARLQLALRSTPEGVVGPTDLAGNASRPPTRSRTDPAMRRTLKPSVSSRLLEAIRADLRRSLVAVFFLIVASVVGGTLQADATDADVAAEVVDAFEDDDAVTIGGPTVIGLPLGEQVGKDLGKAQMLAFPILFFRGRGAVLPLVVGTTTVLSTFLVMAAISTGYGLNIFALNLVIGLGLGLAIDYTLCHHCFDHAPTR